MLDVVGTLNENCGQSLVEVTGSEVGMPCVVETEDDAACVVKIVDDVSKDEDIVAESETLSIVEVDVGGFSVGAEDTGESPVAGLELSEPCAEITDSAS